MYDYDKTPTADSAEEWLHFLSFWNEEHWNMIDRFLQDFSSPWRGEPDAVPSQSLYDETVALARKQEKVAGTISIAGFQMGLDKNGALTIIQSGSHYIIVPANQVSDFLAALNSLTNAPEQPVIDLNTNGPIGLRNAPSTNAQMSMRQNELTIKYLKQRP